MQEGVTGVAWGRPELWSCDPQTGVLSLSEAGLAAIVNADPIERWYIMDEQPMSRGQYATIHHCRHRVTGRPFAAKFSQRRRRNADATPAILHEIAVNAVNTGRANVRLHDVFRTDNAFVLIMELATGGDLQSILDEECIPYERHVAACMRQVLGGLVAMHGRGLAHLDIKPQNIVLMGQFPECDVKLCDFEISRLLTPGYEIRDILGTPDYVAPEILCFEPLTTKTDMWSFGVMVYSLLTGFSPFTGDDDTETFLNISHVSIDFPKELFEDVSEDAIDFIRKLLVRLPEDRMSAKECLSHSWMRKTSVVERTPEMTPTPSSVAPEIPAQQDSSSSCVKVEDGAQQKPVVQSHAKPPVYPQSTTLPVPTPLLNKGSRMGSRQNLNKLRTISKSREVLSERIQMLNIKKTLSKSRERLYDPKLSLSASKEDLLEHQSLSQSIEALTALSKLHENGALYRSCNNIFIPKFKPHLRTAITNERMFRSMASIDQILRGGQGKEPGYFESKLTNECNYTDMITRRNTDLNILVGSLSSCNLHMHVSGETRLGGLRANPCRGGRTAGGEELCDSNCPTSYKRHDLDKNPCKNNKSERLKKDAQRRRKERLERLNREKERHRKYSLGQSEMSKTEDKSNDGGSSPTLRRGSVCHVERRLQERHERLLEKQERSVRTGNTKNSRRLSSTDSDHSNVSDRAGKITHSHTLPLPKDRSRSITPNRRRSNIYSPTSSDASQASSMESVLSSTENIKHRNSEVTNNKKNTTKSRKYGQINVVNTPRNKIDSVVQKEDTVNSIQEVKPGSVENDEAYLSLEEGQKELLEQNDVLKPLVRFDEELKEDGGMYEIAQPSGIPSIGSKIDSDVTNNSGDREMDVSDKCMGEPSMLTIDEQADSSANHPEAASQDQESSSAETNKIRSKSVCAPPKLDLHLVVPRVRLRSNSVEQKCDDKATEWRELCTGSIAKALRNFAVPEESAA